MIEVSNADRIVFPAIGVTKGDVVAWYESVAERALVHVAGRPLSIRRFPKGLAGPGFFQKNVPPHYPESIARFAVPRSPEATKKHAKKKKPDEKAPPEATIYPVLSLPEHLPWLANQGAIELHVPTARVDAGFKPDRLVVDLDPPADGTALVRRAALIVREAFARHGIASVPVATGSKGYHVVAPIRPELPGDVVMTTMQKLAALLAAENEGELTIAFRIAARGGKVFVDWLRNTPLATVVAPWSLRARPRATIAMPLAWDELEHFAPDAFSLVDARSHLARPDPLADLARAPSDAARFVTEVAVAFDAAGLVLQTFDRFRS
jgi:bifunctional non-homologous end joining protein LigD